MGYFRTVFLAQEISERALALTTETIMLNQGNYTAWHFRRKLLHELGKDLGMEIFWLNSIGLQMEKNYQIWHHRRCIFEMLVRKLRSGQGEESKASEGNSTCDQVFAAEFDYLDAIFASDAKNYHGWSHHIWMIERYELHSEPRHMDLIERMLDNDVQNNSVWSFRYFIVMRQAASKAGKDGHGFSKELFEAELRYVVSKRLPQNWRNEASWAYVRGLLANSKEDSERSLSTNAKRWFIGDFDWLRIQLEKWEAIGRKEAFDKSMIEEGDGNDEEEAESNAQMRYDGLKGNRFVHSTLADFAIANKDYDKAVGYLSELKDLDPIRLKFWEWHKLKV